MDKQLFIKVCDEVIGQQQGMNGIGTLGEKTVHAVLKSYYSPDNINHEIRVGGFVADICTGNEIIEIQTRQFNKLRRKLTAFLAFAPVTIVYPVPYIKYLRWVNPQTGEISPPRKSPKLGAPYIIFDELYKIKEYLVNPNLRLKIVLINLEEYKFLDGWSQDKKKGSSRCDRIPTELVDEIQINCLADYQKLIPETLEKGFTSKDFRKASRLPMNHARTALHVLHYIGAVDRIGKSGNTFLYERRNDNPGTVQLDVKATLFVAETAAEYVTPVKKRTKKAVDHTATKSVQSRRKTSADNKTPIKKAPSKTAPIKKAPTNKAPINKAPTKKAPTKKAPTNKAPTKKPTSKEVLPNNKKKTTTKKEV